MTQSAPAPAAPTNAEDLYTRTLALKKRFEAKCPKASALKGVWYVTRRNAAGEWTPTIEFRESAGGVFLHQEDGHWLLTSHATEAGNPLLTLPDDDPHFEDKLLLALQQDQKAKP